MAIIAVGVCVGFLPHNAHPARIFMGDAGALFLGLLLAASTILVGGRTADQFSGQTFFFFAPLVIPFVILGVPMLDIALAIVRRAARRTSIAMPDKEHLHHRLMRLGHGQRRAVFILWAWTAVLAGFVLAPTYTNEGNALVPFGIAALALILYAIFHPTAREGPAGGRRGRGRARARRRGGRAGAARVRRHHGLQRRRLRRRGTPTPTRFVLAGLKGTFFPFGEEVRVVTSNRSGMRLRRTTRGRVGVPALLALTLVASVPAIVSAAATPVTDPPNVIVVLRPGASSADVAGRHSLRMGEQYQTIFNGFAATVNVQDFADDPDVVRVVPNRTFQLGTLHPHILSGSQMALPPGILPIDQAIDCDPSAPLAPSDQDVTISVRRVGILNSPTAKVDSCDERVDADIAILDTGIDPNHPDLNVAGGFNCTGPDRQAWADHSGHGTGVAGVAAAKDDHQGIVGVAPGARLWSIKVLDANGFGTFEDLLCGFEWVTRNSSRIDVANMSLAGPGADDGACGSIDGDVVHAAICRVRPGACDGRRLSRKRQRGRQRYCSSQLQRGHHCFRPGRHRWVARRSRRLPSMFE